MTEPLTLTVNGTSYQVTADPETPLLSVLRHDLGLKGAKFGCGLEQCGACKVLVDGAAVPSCRLPLRQVAGLPVVTVEGLAPAGSLHPLQEAFVAEQAIQCGYCAAGMIVAAQGLLNRVRYPTDDEIREALADNICRCGVHERVRRAIRLRIGRPDPRPRFTVETRRDLPPPPAEAGLPAGLQRFPELDDWLRIDPAETITIFSGKVEIGQGIKTALAQIAAEELDVALGRITVVGGDTGRTPDEGVTAGSMSIQTSGAALRLAAAEARRALLELAFETLEAETPAAGLAVADGTIADPATGRQVTYWQLLGGRPFGRQLTGTVPPKDAGSYQLVGRPATRLDLVDKVSGRPAFVHDLDLPGLLHGRVVRPPTAAARLVAIDAAPVEQMAGVAAVVRDGSFLGVVAEREEQAVQARDALAAQASWSQTAALPTHETIHDHLLTQPAESNLVQDGIAIPELPPPAQLTADSYWLTADFRRPYHMHASLGPSAAVALWDESGLTVWSHSQGVFLLQEALAGVLGLESDRVRVIHAEGAGCYGHNGAEDAALDAALLARALPGRPVTVTWRREDEHGWEPVGPAMVMRLQGRLADDGRIAAWRHEVWSYPHVSRPRPGPAAESGLLAAWHLERPFQKPQPRNLLGRHFGGYRNAEPLYDLPQKEIVHHFVADSPLRTSSLRSLGGYANVFALESFMDELAAAAGADPVDFRLRHLSDERGRAVIEAAASRAGWRPRSGPAQNGRGQGIAFGQYKNIQAYAAVVVEVTIENGQIRLERAIIAADAGQIVNPDGLSNQLEGGFVQAASWTLAEEVKFDETGVLSLDWESYPLLRFPDVPFVETLLLDRPGFPPLGSGEAAQNPTPAAIANAVFDATGVRLRRLPLRLPPAG